MGVDGEPWYHGVIMILDAFAGYVGQVPAEFWGIVVGAAIALGGVILSDRAQEKRQRADQTHDRTERKKDREFAARKEILLDAATGLYGMTQCVSHLSDLAIPYAQIMKDNQEYAVPVARAYIIASDETIRAMAALSTGVQADLLRLSYDRSELDKAQRYASTIEAKQRSHNEAAERVIERMRQFNFEGMSDPARWQKANAMHDYDRKLALGAAEERDSIGQQTFPRHMALSEEVLKAAKGRWPEIVRVLVAIRRELGVPTDEAELMRVIEDSSKRPTEELERLIARIRADVEARPKKDGEGKA